MMRKKHKRNGCIIACHRLIHNVIKMSFSHPQKKKRKNKKKEAFPICEWLKMREGRFGVKMNEQRNGI